jgi:hypothetical protein
MFLVLRLLRHALCFSCCCLTLRLLVGRRRGAREGRGADEARRRTSWWPAEVCVSAQSKALVGARAGLTRAQ